MSNGEDKESVSTPIEQGYTAKVRSCAKFVRDCFDLLSKAEAEVIAKRLEECADAIDKSPSSLTREKLRGAYEPLHEKQIEILRDAFRRQTWTDYEKEQVYRLCDMAVNSLLYAEEIHRLRDAPLPSVVAKPILDKDGFPVIDMATWNAAVERCAKVCSEFPTVVVPFMRDAITERIRTLKGDASPAAKAMLDLPTPRTDAACWLVAGTDTTVVVDVTVARQLERELAEARFRPMGDNHHNAILCPYCNPLRATASEPMVPNGECSTLLLGGSQGASSASACQDSDRDFIVTKLEQRVLAKHGGKADPWQHHMNLTEGDSAMHFEAATCIKELVRLARSAAIAPTTALTKKQREYIERINARCAILRVRIEEGPSKDYSAERKELHALNWAVNHIETFASPSARAHTTLPPDDMTNDPAPLG